VSISLWNASRINYSHHSPLSACLPLPPPGPVSDDDDLAGLVTACQPPPSFDRWWINEDDVSDPWWQVYDAAFNKWAQSGSSPVVDDDDDDYYWQFPAQCSASRDACLADLSCCQTYTSTTVYDLRGASRCDDGCVLIRSPSDPDGRRLFKSAFNCRVPDKRFVTVSVGQCHVADAFFLSGFEIADVMHACR
jgi:hypothetical protein